MSPWSLFQNKLNNTIKLISELGVKDAFSWNYSFTLHTCFLFCVNTLIHSVQRNPTLALIHGLATQRRPTFPQLPNQVHVQPAMISTGRQMQPGGEIKPVT